ncbi:MAG: NAD(+) synthetase [Thaumarchaeota archaeon]|nr:NAD(+) synthetase [Nitrososphaerota archaeon]|tara:strand:+ start:16330 stop:17169 length:840 start_codon:yes stop_codon:yes gene_type:complete
MNREILNEVIGQDYTKIRQDIEMFLKNSVSQNKADGVIFGLSGGIDSTVVAYLAAKIFGKRVLALVMPDSTVSPSSETSDALKVVDELELDYKLIDIDVIHKVYSNHLEPDERALGNLRARIRANIIYYYANLKNFLVLGTSDKSEYSIGYFTKFGDGSADLLPISKLYKTQLREFAKILGVPNNIITKKSSPNLWKEHIAEEELGITYEEVDSILYCLEKRLTIDEIIKKTEIKKESVEKIYHMHEKSWHKRLPPKMVVENMDEINKLISRMENDANI